MKNIIRLVFRLKNMALYHTFILVFFSLSLQLKMQRIEALYVPWLRCLCCWGSSYFAHFTLFMFHNGYLCQWKTSILRNMAFFFCLFAFLKWCQMTFSKSALCELCGFSPPEYLADEINTNLHLMCWYQKIYIFFFLCCCCHSGHRHKKKVFVKTLLWTSL